MCIINAPAQHNKVTLLVYMCKIRAIVQTINNSECLPLVWNLGFCLWTLQLVFFTNIKIRELAMGEKQTILILRKKGKSIRAIAQASGGIANTVLKKKETSGVLSSRNWPEAI